MVGELSPQGAGCANLGDPPCRRMTRLKSLGRGLVRVRESAIRIRACRITLSTQSHQVGDGQGAMWQALGGLLPIAVAVALSTVPITVTILILLSPNRNRAALPFLRRVGDWGRGRDRPQCAGRFGSSRATA